MDNGDDDELQKTYLSHSSARFNFNFRVNQLTLCMNIYPT